jgi:hypothetical protein
VSLLSADTRSLWSIWSRITLLNLVILVSGVVALAAARGHLPAMFRISAIPTEIARAALGAPVLGAWLIHRLGGV